MPAGTQEEFTRRKRDFDMMEQEASKASHSKLVSEERSNYITTQFERVQVRAGAFNMLVPMRHLIPSFCLRGMHLNPWTKCALAGVCSCLLNSCS